MSDIIITRNHEGGNWIAYHGGLYSANSFTVEGDDARDAVLAVQAKHPNANVGVHSRVFGAATVRAFGSVVWMKPNLEHLK